MGLDSLTVPELDGNLPFDVLLRTPSIALFVDRARAHRPAFTPTEQQIPLLVQPIRHLDGLPLPLWVRSR